MKFTKMIVLSGLLITSLGTKAEPTEEVLLGLDIMPNSIELHVTSGGCTSAENFSIEVNKGITGKPPYLVSVKRIKPDNCKMRIPDGVKVSFNRKKLGLDGLVEFTVTNKFGNTSQHR